MRFITIGMYFDQFPKGTMMTALLTVGNLEMFRLMVFELAILPTESTTHLRFK